MVACAVNDGFGYNVCTIGAPRTVAIGNKGRQMTAAKKYLPHYTIDDYQLWAGDWELWNGIAVAMTPSPFGRHQALASRLLVALQNG